MTDDIKKPFLKVVKLHEDEVPPETPATQPFTVDFQSMLEEIPGAASIKGHLTVVLFDNGQLGLTAGGALSRYDLLGMINDTYNDLRDKLNG